MAFSRARPSGPRARSAYWLCGTLLFSAWNLGTVAGMLAGAAVPDPDAFGVDAAFPAGLLALLLPGLRRRDARRVAPAAAVLALLATPLLPAGLPVLVGLLGLFAAGPPPEPPPTADVRRVRPTRHRPRRDRPVTWTALLVLAAGTYLLARRRARPARPAPPARPRRALRRPRRDRPARRPRVTVSTLLDGGAFAGWARPVGVLAGALAAWRRAPFVLVVLLAAGTTAGLRALGVP